MIDTHLHVWDRARSSYRWLDDAPEPLRDDHLLPEALAAVEPHGFDQAVLVQADETLEETAYLLELTRTDPRVVGAVCFLPLEDPATVAEQLPALIDKPAFVGIRNLTHDRPDPDWILGDEQRRSLALLEASAVPLDYIAVTPRHLENLVTLAVRHPGLTLVLDHLGTPPIGRRDDAPRWADQLAAAAALPNVVAKVSGIYPTTPDRTAFAEQLGAALATAIDCFGADRLMLGSDWPMGTVAGGTDVTLRTLVSAVDALAPDQADAVRHGTASRVYSLDAR